ncbi:hypothetical protein Tco_1089572, partial [Tanacetum coccineum]
VIEQLTAQSGWDLKMAEQGGWKKQKMHEWSMTNFKGMNYEQEYILLGMTEAKDSEVCKITRADGSSSFHGDIQALLRRLDRQDLSQLYSLINMLVEKKYALKKKILKKMINLKIEAEEDSTMASELIKFIKSQIAEQS